jgi:hypothetical protein
MPFQYLKIQILLNELHFDVNSLKNLFFEHIGKNKVKRAKDAKIKVIFQGLHMTHFIYMLIYNLKFCILNI